MRRVLLVSAVSIAYLSSFAPERFVLIAGERLLGDPGYNGFWGAFVPHVLFYSTLTAACCAALWYVLCRTKLLPPPSFAVSRDVLLWAAYGGVAGLVLAVAAVTATGAGAIHWTPPDGWKIAGNVFSNFYEEFIFRGFLLAALSAAAGFWPGAIVSSVLWASQHTQYPLQIRVAIAAIGVLWCCIVRRTKSLSSAYGAHMLLDIVGDSIIG